MCLNYLSDSQVIDFSPTELSYINKILKKYLMGIIISRNSGDVLYSFQIDSSIKIDLFSQFIAALSIFGEEVGKIKRILIEGLNIEMTIVSSKNGLIFTSFFRPEMVSDYLDQEASKCLQIFYSTFKEPLDKGRCNQLIYESFEPQMYKIIRSYLIRIGALDTNYLTFFR